MINIIIQSTATWLRIIFQFVFKWYCCFRPFTIQFKLRKREFLRVMLLFIERNCSFFMGIIFCSSVVLVWTFKFRGVYNFITKEANIPVNLVPFFNDVLFLFYRFLKSGVTNDLKSLFLWKSKKLRVIYSKRQNFAAHKTLVWSTYIRRNATATIFF